MPPDPPIGALLAGGRARRLGGSKATAPLGGRPLLEWPLQALRAALADVVVVAKAQTPLPELGVPVWVEPDEPRHPRAGIVHALERADGRCVLACAVDLPLVTPVLVRAVAEAPAAPVAVPRAGGRLQPLFARYAPEALPGLLAAPADEPLTATVEALGPHVIDMPEDAFVNVNTPEELRAVAQRIVRD